MAELVPISGGPEQAKIRSIFAPALLPIVTLGIYTLVWWYKINKEMVDLGRKRGTTELGDNPTMSLIAYFPGAILVVPVIMTFIGTYKRAKLAQQMTGVPESNQLNGWIFALALFVFSPVAAAYLQDGMNKTWQADSGRLAAAAPAQTWTPEAQAPVAPPAPAAPPMAPPAPPAGDPGPPPPPPAPPAV
ncbi:MAG: DUF4234 domain-containing protein [Thermoleophilaceae bacterium]|nr:DUF4234 domain-containing protein [Thermoleophilaceae bacterium]